MATNFLVTNFLALEDQDFIIPIYKKIYIEGETKKDFSFPVKRFLLSNNGSNDERTRHWVTFDGHDAFLSNEVSSLENCYLTLWYISSLIESKLKTLNIPYQIGDEFLYVIDLIIDESELGKESICIIQRYNSFQRKR